MCSRMYGLKPVPFKLKPVPFKLKPVPFKSTHHRQSVRTRSFQYRYAGRDPIYR